ncbi:hypothetical protein CEXT_602971 [Caerostris extrusa]|uniref:Uncharacterized protein n=1 Tax=Caerostris extrusa TaxID=172846 RepID=A0AAV4U6H5_CAEEX|nr:hypothetical protein CEXT_602971 [Caerostris extrusa]
MFDLLTIRQMDARGNGKFIWNYFLAFQSRLQTKRKGPANKGYPSESKDAPPLPLSPCPLLDRFDLCLLGQKGLRACNCGLENDSSKIFLLWREGN